MADRTATLAAVREKYPQYADMKDDDLGAALAAKYPEYADLAQPADTRTSFRRWYDTIAQPATRAVGSVIAQPSEAAMRLYDQAAGTPKNISDAGARAGAAAGEGVARFVVPQSPLEAGAQAATMGAGGVAAKAGWTGLKAAMARIGGGALGGEVGNQLEGGPAGKGAAVGGGAAAVGEGVMAALPWLARALPGMKGRILGQDARRAGAAVEDISPELGGATDAAGLRGLQGPGREALSGMKEQATGAIEQVIGNRPLTIPSIAEQPMTFRQANDALSEIGARAFSKNPLDRTFNGVDQRRLYGQVAQEIRDALSAAERGLNQGAQAAGDAFVEGATRRALPAPSGPTVQPSSPTGFQARPLSQREGVERTLEAAEAGSAGAPYREGAADVSSARPFVPSGRMGQVDLGGPAGLATVGATAGPERPSLALALWDAAQARYRRGMGVLDLFEKPGAYTMYSNETRLNTPFLQREIAKPRVEAELRAHLGDEGFDRLSQALLRGGKLGTADELAPGPGRWSDAIRMMMEGKGGTASVLALPARTLLPNAPSRYAGRAPLTPPESMKTIIDMALERGAGGLADNTGLTLRPGDVSPDTQRQADEGYQRFKREGAFSR